MKKAILLLFMIILLTSCEFLLSDTKGEIYYVSVASDYVDSGIKLLNATINDQRAMDAEISYSATKSGTTLHSYSITSEKGQTVLNGEVFTSNISEKIITTLKSISQTATERDTIIFYYSGHGAEGTEPIQDKHTGEDGKTEPGTLCFKAETSPAFKVTDYVTVEELSELFSNIKAKVLLIIDSCYSGNFSVDSRPDSSWEEAMETFFKADDFSNIWVLAAAKEDEESFEPGYNPEKILHGYFTSVILEGLGYNAAEEYIQNDSLITSEAVGYNKNICFSELAELARKKVPNMQYNQHPQSSLSFADLVLF